jgi:hypothetical protein
VHLTCKKVTASLRVSVTAVQELIVEARQSRAGFGHEDRSQTQDAYSGKKASHKQYFKKQRLRLARG